MKNIQQNDGKWKQLEKSSFIWLLELQPSTFYYLVFAIIAFFFLQFLHSARPPRPPPQTKP